MHRVSWICPRLGQSEVVGAGHCRCVAGDEQRCRRRHLLHLPVRGGSGGGAGAGSGR